MSLEGAEKVEFPQTLTEGALASFHDEEQRELDFKEFMMGEQHQTGGRHDLDSRGLSTDSVAVREDAIINPHQPPELPPEDDFVQDIANPLPQDTNWQQEYGRSENEKGELRRQLQATMEKNYALESAAQAGNVQLPTFFNQPSTTPQPQVAQAPAQPATFDPALMPRIVDKEDGEPMFAEDVDKILREKVAPVFFNMQQQLDAAQTTAAQANQRMFDAEKARLGISPQEERVFVAQNPWLQGMRDPNSYIEALGQIKKRADLVAQAQPAQATPTQPVSPGQRMEVRRRTFVESSTQTAGPPQQDSRTLDPNAQFIQAWAQTKLLPYEKQAAAQRELLKSRGAARVSGYRDPSVLTS